MIEQGLTGTHRDGGRPRQSVVLSPYTVSDDVDLLVLDGATPTARFHGLVGALPLYEAVPGLFARTQTAAAPEFYETAWLRAIDLQRMATS